MKLQWSLSKFWKQFEFNFEFDLKCNQNAIKVQLEWKWKFKVELLLIPWNSSSGFAGQSRMDERQLIALEPANPVQKLKANSLSFPTVTNEVNQWSRPMKLANESQPTKSTNEANNAVRSFIAQLPKLKQFSIWHRLIA